MQHYFVDTNFGQSCSKIEIWFICNCQTKRVIVALFLYPEIPPCQVLFWARWSNICLFTIPAQSPIFTAQFASQNPHNFLFFPRTLSEGLFVICKQNLKSGQYRLEIIFNWKEKTPFMCKLVLLLFIILNVSKQ